MIVSFDKHFLFLHIPKTAGKSVSAALRSHRNPLERCLKARVIRRLPLVNVDYRYVNFDAHTHWSLLQAKSILPLEVYEKLFKFAFVRHPVEWQLSMFKHIMRYEHLQYFRKRFAPVYRHRRFEHYVRWRIESGPVPQITQMLDLDGKLLVDFVGRFESLASDFRHVCQKLGMEANLGQINRSPAEQSIAISDKVRTMIIEAYEADMTAFGYEEKEPRKGWKLDRGKQYLSEADVLRRVNRENFDPWRMYYL